jgi:anti-sigma B factor antagonist
MGFRPIESPSSQGPMGGEMTLKVTSEHRNDVVVIAIEGRADAAATDALTDAFHRVKTGNGLMVLVIGPKMAFIDSGGVRILLSFAKWINRAGGTLRLAELQPDVRRLFEVLSLDQVIPIHATASDALASFAR